MFTNIIWASDGSEAAEHPLPTAVDLASQACAKLTVVPPDQTLGGAAAGPRRRRARRTPTRARGSRATGTAGAGTAAPSDPRVLLASWERAFTAAEHAFLAAAAVEAVAPAELRALRHDLEEERLWLR